MTKIRRKLKKNAIIKRIISELIYPFFIEEHTLNGVQILVYSFKILNFLVKFTKVILTSAIVKLKWLILFKTEKIFKIG